MVSKPYEASIGVIVCWCYLEYNHWLTKGGPDVIHVAQVGHVVVDVVSEVYHCVLSFQESNVAKWMKWWEVGRARHRPAVRQAERARLEESLKPTSQYCKTE